MPDTTPPGAPRARTAYPVLAGALVAAALVVRGIAAIWFVVTPLANASHSTLLVNGVALRSPTTFTGLAVVRDTVSVTTPSQGLLSPLALATPAGTPGALGGEPATLVLAITALVLVVLGSGRRSLLASLLGVVAAWLSLGQVGALEHWATRPDFLYTRVAFGPGVAEYQLALWVLLGLTVAVAGRALVRKLVAAGERWSVALHHGEHAALGESALDRFTRALGAMATEHSSTPSA